MVCDNNKNFDNQIKGESVDSILKSILQHRRIRFDNLRKEKPDLSNDEIELIIKKEHFYFRGESSYHKFRTPSLYLQENLTMEGSEYYYRSLINELGRDDYQENTSLVRLMSELQHYGAKTRMLDITKNPLIALYFAVEKDDDEPGFVFIYKSDIDNEKFDLELNTIHDEINAYKEIGFDEGIDFGGKEEKKRKINRSMSFDFDAQKEGNIIDKMKKKMHSRDRGKTDLV